MNSTSKLLCTAPSAHGVELALANFTEEEGWKTSPSASPGAKSPMR